MLVIVLAQDMRAVGRMLALRDFWRHLRTHPEVSLGDDVLSRRRRGAAFGQADPLAALGEARAQSVRDLRRLIGHENTRNTLHGSTCTFMNFERITCWNVYSVQP